MMQKNRQYNMTGKGKLFLRERLSALSAFSRIFVVLSLVLLVFGLCSLGAFNGTGKSVSVAPSDSDVSFAYTLSYAEGQSLAAIYVNAGAVYVDVGAERSGDTLQLRARYYNGANWNNSIGSTAYIADIYALNDSPSYKSNANYNWVAIAEGKKITETFVRLSVLSGSAAGVVNEVAFVDGNGKTISARVADAYCDGVTREEVARTLDAQGAFHASSSYRYNFSYAEEYILQSIHGIELGGEGNTENVYVMSSEYNSFGILVYALFTWIFGKSTFALRLPSFLASFGLFVLAFLLGRKLFRDDKYGLALAVLFLLGGGFFGLGMTGTPQALGLFFAVLGIYFMYRFFSEGVRGDRPAVGALPVLCSGICSAAAFAVSTATGLVCAVSLLLFVCGLLRLYNHRAYLVAKAERNAQSAAAPTAPLPSQDGSALSEKIRAQSGVPAAEIRSPADEEAERRLEEALTRLDGEYLRKLRAAVGWLGCAVAFAVLLLVLAAIPTYPSFVRFYGNGSFFDMIGRGIAQCFSAGDVTPFTAANASTPWGWFVALRAAILYQGGGGAAQVYALPNFAAAYAAAAAFVFCSVYLLVAARGHGGEKGYKRALRAYIGLTVGMLAGLLPFLFVPLASAAQSGAFYFFYLSFIVLAFYIGGGGREENKKSERFAAKRVKIGISDAVCIALFVLLFALFVAGMPAVFGWQIGAEAAAGMFGWMPPVALLPAA